MRWAALALLGVLAACSGGPSDTCSSGTSVCDGTSFSVCDNGKLRKITCKGPAGCMNNVCDTSTHTVGDGCVGTLSRCDPANGSQILQCVNGVLAPFRSCSGPRQCFVDSMAVGCDVTIGDTCPVAYEARYFCDTINTQQVLKCADGGVGLYSTCSGVKNCANGDGGLVCQ